MKNEMSQHAYDTLVEERKMLIKVHNEARRRVEDAQNDGGDGEGLNGIEAVFEADEIGVRLARVERAIAEATIVEGGVGVVRVGAIVVIDMGDGPETYRYEQHAGSDCIGTTSPIGSAIAGLKPGDSATITAPGGAYQVRIIEVR
jgi:transcription elongation GreA/GreB family factor